MAVTNEPTVTMKDVVALLAHAMAEMEEKSRANTLLAIQEMRKPTEAEQRKLDEDAAKLKQKQAARLQLAKAEEDRKVNRAKHCPHQTVHQGTGMVKHAWRGQIHTPAGEAPYFIPTCMQCQTQLPKIRATLEQIKSGVNLDQYPGLNEDTLRQWSKTMENASLDVQQPQAVGI